MEAEQVSFFFGHVKVALRSRSPKLWGWAVHRDGSDLAVEKSETLFPHAEDAWKAGQRVLASLEAKHPPRPARIRLAA